MSSLFVTFRILFPELHMTDQLLKGGGVDIQTELITVSPQKIVHVPHGSSKFRERTSGYKRGDGKLRPSDGGTVGTSLSDCIFSGLT